MFLLRAYRFRRVLSLFFIPSELEDFLRLQAQTGLLVSGEAVLHFLLRTAVDVQQLQLYVHVRHRRAVLAWIQSTRYAEVPGELSSVTQTLQRHVENFVISDREEWSPLNIPQGDGVSFKLILEFEGSPRKVVIHFSTGPVIKMILSLPMSEFYFTIAFRIFNCYSRFDERCNSFLHILSVPTGYIL